MMIHENITNSVFFTLSCIISIVIVKYSYKSAIPDEKAIPADINQSKCVVVSTPGKALIAGGYVVLESPNIGITIAVTARFYVSVITKVEIDSEQGRDNVDIVIVSPQFYNTFTYRYNITNNRIEQVSGNLNGFIEKCLIMVLKFAHHHLGEDEFYRRIKVSPYAKLQITLQADNDFYSQVNRLKDKGLPLLSTSLKTLPKFIPCPQDSSGRVIVSKTGMGSSAALTTSLTGALLQYFNVVNLGRSETEQDLRIVHNVAQLAHSIAQGKIGSGFDISAAVYGSQIFSRFSAENLHICMEMDCSSKVIYDSVMNTNLWTQSWRKFSLPPKFDIMMGDVSCGAESASMARKVLNWLQSSSEARRIWNNLVAVNTNIATTFENVITYSQTNQEEYDLSLSTINSLQVSTSSTIEPRNILKESMSAIKGLFSQARSLLRQIGTLAEVEIEPSEQTLLADRTESIDGVLCAGVPGAGGRDALFCIIFSENARSNVETLWANWGNDHDIEVCPLLLTSDTSSIGIKLEECF